MQIFQYDIMIHAFIVGILLSVIIPCIGMIVVLRRLSMMGDALSHSSLAGVAVGLVAGVNPVLSATVVCVAAALGVEGIRKKMPHYGDLAVAIVMATGIGLAGVLSGFVKKSANFNSFLFGSIVTISKMELVTVVIVSIVVLFTFALLYKELFYITFDERGARLSGIPVRMVHFIFTLLTAVTISLASRTVGALMVSSLMVLPVACAMQISKSYRQTLFLAIIFAMGFTVGGLYISYYARLKPGSTIVLLGVICLIGLLTVKQLTGKGRGRKN